MKHVATIAVLLGLLTAGMVSAADPDPKLAFKLDEKGNFVFDTGVIKGSLAKEGKGPALQATDVATNTPINHANGLLIPYRFLIQEKRFGVGAWEWPRTGKLLDDGAAEIQWASTDERPFDVKATCRWKAADTLDMTLTFAAGRDLEKFELFVGSYFKNFPKSRAYVKDAGDGKPGFVESPKDKGDWHCYPKNDEVLSIIKDGRWKHPPYPLTWTIRPALAAPLGMRQQPETGLTVLIMAPPQDCFAMFTPEQNMSLGSFYFTLFGKDVKKGETLTSRPRLVFGKNITDEQAVAKYQEYLKDLK